MLFKSLVLQIVTDEKLNQYMLQCKDIVVFRMDMKEGAQMY